SGLAGCRVYLKFEIFQFTASVKERGALNKILSLPDAERRRGVLTVSAGNHAQAVAHHCGRLGIPATVVMPRHTAFSKVARTEASGAEVILTGESFAEAVEAAKRIGAERHLTLVHPFDDPDVMAGQGTIALELLEDFPELDALVVPVGGGGLISGCAVAAKAVKPDIDVVGVQAAAFPGMKALFEPVKAEARRQTIADGIAVKTPGELTRRVDARGLDDILLVKENEIERADCVLAEIKKVGVEGAGATPLHAVVAQAERFAGKRIGLVLSGGNIVSRMLAGC